MSPNHINPPCLLPIGPFTTIGSQIVSSSGIAIRICSVGWNWYGGPGTTPDLLGSINYKTAMQALVNGGINVIKICTSDIQVIQNLPISGINTSLNPDLSGLTYNQALQTVVNYGYSIGLQFIIESHCNEGGVDQQANGLWYDLGGDSNGTDGNGNIGTITDAIFISTWQTRANLFVNNPAVIGYDIRHEPLCFGNTGSGCNWGTFAPNGGSATAGLDIDLAFMYQRVGNAIQAIDSSKLIICQGPQNSTGSYTNVGNAYWGDLSAAGSYLIDLNVDSKVVYSNHINPSEITPGVPDSGLTYQSYFNTGGYLSQGGIAPYFVGECGDSMITTDATNWCNMFIKWMNGNDVGTGSLEFTGSQQGISWSWWKFSIVATGTAPQYGILNSTGNAVDVTQAPYWQQMLPWIVTNINTSNTIIPSANDTIIVYPSASLITDANGNQWGINSSQQVLVNGIADTSTGSVIEIAYVINANNQPQIWQENATNTWWFKNIPSDSWNPPPGTPISPLPSTNQGIINLQNIPTTNANVGFTVSGILLNFNTAPVLQFSDDAGVLNILPPGNTVSNTNFSFSHPGMTQGNHIILVANSANTLTNSGFLVYSISAANSGSSGSQTSSNNTVIVYPSTQLITDANGNQWGINSGRSVTVNGTPDTTTSFLVELVYTVSANGRSQIWQENSNNLWWYKYIPSDSWLPAAGTSISPLPNTLTQFISVNNITALVNTPFNVSGVLQNFFNPILQYNDNNGLFGLLPGGANVTNTSFSFTHPGMPLGPQTIVVANSFNTSTNSANINYVVGGIPGTRFFYNSPGGDGTYWVTPICSNAQWSAANASMTLDLRHANTINAANSGQTIAVGQASDPIITFSSTSISGQQRDPQLSAQIHVPIGTTIANGVDAQLNLFDQTQPYKIWSFTPSTITLNGSIINSIQPGCLVSATFGETDDCSGSMEDQITGNYGIEAAAGVIRHWQIAAANGNSQFSIQNSLQFSIDPKYLRAPAAWNDFTTIDPQSPYGLPYISWPSTHSDLNGPTIYTGHIPFGSTVGIPSFVAMPQGLTQGGQLLWNSAQQFGWYCRGSFPGGISLFAEPQDEHDAILVGMRNDLPIIANNLYVLINQRGPSTLKGGGTPVYTLPPKLNLGSNPANNAITISQLGSNLTTNVSFTMSGFLINYLNPATLTYSDDGGNFQPLTPGANTTLTQFSFVHPGSTQGTHTTTITDGVVQSFITYTIFPVAQTGGNSVHSIITSPVGSTQQYRYPLNWNSLNNIIEGIGGGGAGSTNGTSGGGGAYSKLVNIAGFPGANTPYIIGAGATPGQSSGGNTTFASSGIFLATAGQSGQPAKGGIGGQAASSIGTIKYDGGNAPQSASLYGAQGGGGAAGPFGSGAAGTLGGLTPSGGGGAGGGNSGGTSGTQPDIFGEGATGGNNSSGQGGGIGGILASGLYTPKGLSGTSGGGGGGSVGYSITGITLPNAGNGGNGTDFDTTHGSGGGGGGTGGAGGTLTAPLSVLSTAGTKFADIAAIHLYPMLLGSSSAAQTISPTKGDLIANQILLNYSNTINGFSGYTPAQANAMSVVITEFGYSANGGVVNGTTVDIPTQGKNLLTGLLNAWTKSIDLVCVYELYNLGNHYGLFSTYGTPYASATYMHNFTTVLTDTGTNYQTFLPNTFNYSVTNLPTTGKTTLFQKSFGNNQIVLWNVADNWNVATGSVISVANTNVTISIVGTANINVYDPTNGLSPIKTSNNTNNIIVTLKDYPIIVDFSSIVNNTGGNTASRTNDFLNIIGINGNVGSNSSIYINAGNNIVLDTQYIGARHFRDSIQTGTAQLAIYRNLANSGISMIAVPPNSGTANVAISLNVQGIVNQANVLSNLGTNFIYAFEGCNNPIQFPVTFNNQTSNGSGTQVSGPPVIQARFQNTHLQSFTDHDNVVWTISINAQAVHNGTIDTSTSQLTRMSFVNNQIWHQTWSGAWFFKNHATDSVWTQGSNPLPNGLPDRCYDFLSTMGYNTHMDYAQNQSTIVNVTAQALIYLNSTLCRHQVLFGTQVATLATLVPGLRFCLLTLQNNATDASADPGNMNLQLQTLSTTNIFAWEGINEPEGYSNNTDTTAMLNGLNSGIAAALRTIPSQNAVPMVNMSHSLAFGGLQGAINFYTAMGNQLGVGINWGCWHGYSNYGTPFGAPIGSSATGVSAALACNAVQTPGRPWCMTEWGYEISGPTGAPDGNQEATPLAGSKMTINGYLDCYLNWCAGAFFFELFEDTGEGYRLFDYSANPNAYAVSIHNFTTVLLDTGTTAATFIPYPLNYSISGSTNYNVIVLQKSTGVYNLVFWNNDQTQNPSTGVDTPPTPVNLTITLGQQITSAAIYDPTAGVGTTPMNNFGVVSSIPVSIQGGPIIVQIVAPSALSPSFVPIANFMASYYSALKAIPTYSNIPMYSSNQISQQPNNTGMQYLSVPIGNNIGGIGGFGGNYGAGGGGVPFTSLVPGNGASGLIVITMIPNSSGFSWVDSQVFGTFCFV